MFNLKYNSVAGGIVVLQLLSLVLLFVLFGISNDSDTFLFTISIVGSIQLIEIMFIEQFMFFYHKIFEEDENKAEQFYYFACTLAVGVGIFCFIILMLIQFLNLEILAFGLKGDRLSTYGELLYTMGFGLLFYPILAVNDRLLNAKGYFGWSYVLASSMHIFLFLSLLLVFLIPTLKVSFLGCGYTLGIIVGAITSTYFIIQNFSYKIKFVFYHEEAKSFVTKSIWMRFGHNIFIVLFYPITNFFLAQLPSGAISIFYYVYRAVLAIFSVTAGPSFKMYMAKLSLLWAKRKLYAIRLYSLKYIRIASYIYFTGVFFVYLAIEFLLPLAMEQFDIGISLSDLSTIENLYLLIALWQLIILVESAYVGILITGNQHKQFIVVNMLFIILYLSVCYLLIDYINIYALGVAALCSQVVNFYLYRRLAIKFLERACR